MFRRFLHAIKYAAKEESFAAVAGAAISLVLVGTITYSLGEGWNVADGFYFAVCTLTTSSIADPHLTLTHEALKIFTALYVLTGIGILVEVARQLGVGFVKLRAEQSATRHARRHKVRRRHSRRNSRVAFMVGGATALDEKRRFAREAAALGARRLLVAQTGHCGGAPGRRDSVVAVAVSQA